jgi:hypothetical protein
MLPPSSGRGAPVTWIAWHAHITAANELIRILDYFVYNDDRARKFIQRGSVHRRRVRQREPRNRPLRGRTAELAEAIVFALLGQADGFATIDRTNHRRSSGGLDDIADGQVAACRLLPLDQREFDATWSGWTIQTHRSQRAGREAEKEL